MTYEQFLAAKAAVAPRFAGFEVDEASLNPALKPHTRRMVAWGLNGGRRAWFASFGLHKTATQIEAMRVIVAKTGKPALIIAPLGVRREFIEEAKRRFTGDFAVDLRFIRQTPRALEPAVYLTNYESVREGKIDMGGFVAVSLDEAAILRGFGGTKTFREFMAVIAGDDRRDKSQKIVSDGVQFRFVATATPSPNEFIELLSYAAFLGVMDVSAAKTRFFKRNSEKADNLTLMPHKEREFWLWVASWALFVTKPSDLDQTFSDESYDLPPLDVRWHELPTDHSNAGMEKDGQVRLVRDTAMGLSGAAHEKRDSLPARMAKLMEIRADNPAAHRIIWHDLERERTAIEKAIPGVATVYGAQKLDDRETIIADFAEGRTAEIGAKPVMLGSGTNLQKHCAWQVYLGIGFKFNDFIQSVHRLCRFGQQAESVRVDLIYTEAERGVRQALERKWAQHNELVAKMTGIIREYGLTDIALQQALSRSMGVERVEITGENYRIVNNDCVQEVKRLASDSIDMILTSIPFSTQYEYSPNYADFGHTDDDAHFWRQMGFLIPELLRALSPGRWCAIHVKDRIIPGGVNGLGFQTLSTFHMDCVYEFKRHGFAYLGMKTIATDVVRENNQTYRLGWTEQCKDATKMGAGVPEYLLMFRKPPSDRSNGYADRPVKKPKKEWDRQNKAWINEDGYSRARWQLDAHAFARSSGDRPLKPGDLDGLPADVVYKLWKRHNLAAVYDFEHHVQIGEHLEMQGRLPPTFMLLPPHSLHPDIWSDVARMVTLNSVQASKGREMHLCPLQFDIVDRAIAQLTEPGETVLDPFGGLMTVPCRALKLGRKGIGIELSPGYFLDGAKHVEAYAIKATTPTLFEALAEEDGGAADAA